jgi:hypothetical protein
MGSERLRTCSATREEILVPFVMVRKGERRSARGRRRVSREVNAFGERVDRAARRFFAYGPPAGLHQSSDVAKRNLNRYSLRSSIQIPTYVSSRRIHFAYAG